MDKKNVWILVEFAIICVLLLVIGFLLGEGAKKRPAEEQWYAENAEEETVNPEIPQEPVEETSQETTEPTPIPVEEALAGEEKPAIEYVDNGQIDIVVFGDSIWDDAREGGSVSEQISALTGYQIYNCAVGGTSASAVGVSTDITNGWNNQTLNGMVYVANGELDISQLDGTAAKDVMKQVDFSTVEYLVISYGLNDYFSNTELGQDSIFDMTTYAGAIRHAIHKMKLAYPWIDVILVAPTYCDIWDDAEDCTHYTYGNGILADYVQVLASVAKECETYYIDAYHDFDINKDTFEKYIRDGVHFTADGRTQYATRFTDYLKQIVDGTMKKGIPVEE